MKVKNPFKKVSVQPKKTITLKHTEQFHKNKHKIGNIVISVMDEHEIIYGARALNQRFPSHLDRHTKDFDIFTPTPKKDAKQTEKALDKAFGGDFFYVIPAEHPGTMKVKAHATDETYADYTKPDKKVPYDKIKGRKYATLSFMKKTFETSLANPEFAHRHPKDRDAINRIKIFKKRSF